ncbi:MAG TPA: helix-turn-helix domain-containing protein, partial [Streptosporangiaceae bacterium]|nr:helix-turn-helix domain-containing protein [Streptosporangiaceae bacterium]
DERGFQAVRVDDIVRRAQISHGTFYLYFSNKEDLFKALLRDALHDMSLVTDEFPVVTRNEAGRAALQRWVHEFCEVYATHAAVMPVVMAWVMLKNSRSPSPNISPGAFAELSVRSTVPCAA